jgi:hypothetical protein
VVRDIEIRVLLVVLGFVAHSLNWPGKTAPCGRLREKVAWKPAELKAR